MLINKHAPESTKMVRFTLKNNQPQSIHSVVESVTRIDVPAKQGKPNPM